MRINKTTTLTRITSLTTSENVAAVDIYVEEFYILGCMLCCSLKVRPYFEGTCSLHLKDRRLNQARHQHKAGSILHGLIFNPEDVGGMFR
jgi:hypothetical protein